MNRGVATAATAVTVPVTASSPHPVTEFLEYAISSILFQRQIYPKPDFDTVKRGEFFVTRLTDANARAYLRQALAQINKWLTSKRITEVVLLIVNAENVVLEHWQFDMTYGATLTGPPGDSTASPRAAMGRLHRTLRSIASSAAFLPLLRSKCSFRICVTELNGNTIPCNWRPAEDRRLRGDSEVAFVPLDTAAGSVATRVHYVTGK